MFTRFLEPKTEAAYSFLRVVSGLMFSFHGMQKLFGVFTDASAEVGSQIWVGGLLELVLGLAIAIGLFTRCAAFVASGEMAVAYTQFHWKFELGSKLIPGVNGGELALLYAVLFLFMACKGGGLFSLDSLRKPAQK